MWSRSWRTLAAVRLLLGRTLGQGEVAWWELRNLGKGRGKGWRRETSVAVAAEELEKQLGYSSSRSGRTQVTLKMVDGELSREAEL